jgi:hypothetical protein
MKGPQDLFDPFGHEAVEFYLKDHCILIKNWIHGNIQAEKAEISAMITDILIKG